jgi:hypothetical protein
VIRLFAGLTLPLLVFFALLAALGSATSALAITDGIPLVWLLAYGIWRRKIEPIRLIALAVFALALVLSIAFGGSALPLELRRAVFPGTVGLACLVSLAVHRPLLVIAAEGAPRAPGHETDGRTNLDSPGAASLARDAHRDHWRDRRHRRGRSGDPGAHPVDDALRRRGADRQLVIIGGGVSVGFLYVRHVRSRFQRH